MHHVADRLARSYADCAVKLKRLKCFHRKPGPMQHHSMALAGFLFAIAVETGLAQSTIPAPVNSGAPGQHPEQTQAAPTSPATDPGAAVDPASKPTKKTTNGDRRRAAKIYLASSKLFEKEQFEDAMEGFEHAATLDPSNSNYTLAAVVSRSHAVTALIQAAAKHRIRGDASAARAALARALELDPRSIQATEHLHELGDDLLLGQSKSVYEQNASTIGPAIELAHTNGVQNFHLRRDQRHLIQEVFKAFGVETTIDESVRATQAKFDVDEATFQQAVRSLTLMTGTFYVPLDAHRVLVARNTPENRQQFSRLEMETIYLSGLTSTELTDVGNLARNLFEAPQTVVEPSAGTLTIRASASSLNAFNATIRDLLDGRSQVLLDVRLIQIAHTGERNTGAHLPQQMGVFNLFAEARSILNANQDLVQQIIASGLAGPNDYLAIIGILIASGQVSNPFLSSGFATFGGGSISTFGFTPGSVGINLNLNSSDSRELDQIQLRLGDGEAGTLRTGMRYPIQTSSFSSLAGSTPNIPGLNSAGNSSALSSLLSSLSSVPNVPQIEYQDLGLNLKATPRVMRNGEVALTIDMKIDALAGSSINGNPILNNRAYSGVVTLKEGEAVEVISELDKQESRAISGTPGISEIPGLNELTGKDNTRNYATLLVMMTPHVIRGTQIAGHSPMMRIERGQPGR
jgi:general secretion pathway protein D